MKVLVIIPARKGSKGVPFKNKRVLEGKSLIEYTMDAALEVFNKSSICVSTDDEDIIDIAKHKGIKPPFIRPKHLASDTASSYDVILHAMSVYEQQGFEFDTVVLLQVTSPFRNAEHIKEALSLYTDDLDMVVSVCEAKANPYFNLFEENSKGFLTKSKKGSYTRRQDCPITYEYNGAIYIMNKHSLKKMPMGSFRKIVKYKMGVMESHDIDTEFDWFIAEQIIKYKINLISKEI